MDSPVVINSRSTADYTNMSQDHKQPSGCARFICDPTVLILVGAAVGFGLGIAISDGRASDEVVSWIALPGDLFLRALKCIVLPLVFVNIILATIEMMSVGKAVSIGSRTIVMYTLTTLLAAVEGLVCVLLFKPLFSQHQVLDSTAVAAPVFQFACPSNPALFVSESNGSFFCTSDTALSSFAVTDVNQVFETKSSEASGPASDVSMSQTIQDGIFRKMIPTNIFLDFTNSNFVGVIAFAIVFAIAAQKRPTKAGSPPQKMRLVELLEELNEIFLVLINAIIALTAPAVVSLIAGALGKRSDLVQVFSDIGVLVGATVLAMVFHALVTYNALYWITVKASPIKYLGNILPAQMFAFASASSAATLPVTMKGVAESTQVPESVANFVLSLGATINMDGGAIYFPAAIVFLAVSSGYEDKLDAVSYFLIVLLSTIGSAGTAPVPSASLVLIITAFNTVFDATGTPETFSYILAIDWFVDRCRTTLNVTGDAMMARIVTAMAKVEEEETQDHASRDDDRRQ